MPRDEWAIMRATDIQRRVERELHNRGTKRELHNRGTKRKRRASGGGKAKQAKQRQVEASRLQSLGTTFWFGKHKGKTVREVLASDPGYIRWMASQPDDPVKQSWRTKLLVQHLRQILGMK